MLRTTVLAVALLSAATLAAPAAGQELGKTLTLRWFGQSFVQIETSSRQRVVLDPHAIPTFGTPRVSADVTLVSHPHTDHNQLEVLAEKGRVFDGVTISKDGRKTDWNRVDERVKATRVRTLATYHDATGGMQRGKNSVWVIDADGLVICHLGDLGHELTAEQVKAIGAVDVLLVPVGGIYTINGEVAKKVVDQIKPRRFVVPMHYGVPGFDDLAGPDEFLGEFKNVKKLTETNELLIPVEVPAPPEPTVVHLGWKKADAPVPLKK